MYIIIAIKNKSVSQSAFGVKTSEKIETVLVISQNAHDSKLFAQNRKATISVSLCFSIFSVEQYSTLG